jgi:hypothetical protein
MIPTSRRCRSPQIARPGDTTNGIVLPAILTGMTPVRPSAYRRPMLTREDADRNFSSFADCSAPPFTSRPERHVLWWPESTHEIRPPPTGAGAENATRHPSSSTVLFPASKFSLGGRTSLRELAKRSYDRRFHVHTAAENGNCVT